MGARSTRKNCELKLVLCFVIFQENSSRLEPPVDESNESSQSQLTANFVPSTLPSVQPLTHSIDAIIGSSQKLIQEPPITDSEDDIMHNVSQSSTASFTPNVNFTHSSRYHYFNFFFLATTICRCYLMLVGSTISF